MDGIQLNKYQTKINQLKQLNAELNSNIQNFKQEISKIEELIKKVPVISYETYKSNKIYAYKLAKLNKQLNCLIAKEIKTRYNLFLLEQKLSNQNSALQILNFLDYIKQTNPNNNLFPYKAYVLLKINHMLKKATILNCKLAYFRDVKLRTYKLEKKSVWFLSKKCKSLENKLNEQTNSYNNTKEYYSEKFHAKWVSKLQNTIKDPDYKLNRANTKQKQVKNKEQYLVSLNQIDNEIKQTKVEWLAKATQSVKSYKTIGKTKKEAETDVHALADEYLAKLEQLKAKRESIKYAYNGAEGLDDNNPYAIELINVQKYYNNKVIATKILKNINLKIKKGELVVILGPSGSGKTTLLNIISGMDNVTYGTVKVAGENIIDYNQKELTLFRRKNIGYVFQEYGLLPNLTVKENIQIGQNLQKNKNKIISIDEILTSIGMKECANKYPNELSGGQQQRVSIARSIAKNPNILFGDEPTGAIDTEMSKNIMKLFIDVNKKYKTTIVIVTHNNILADLATTVVYIGNGEIVKIKQNAKPKTVDEINWSVK